MISLLLAAGVAAEFMKQGAMVTVLSTLLTALAWPAALLAATDFIDSKWTIALDRFVLSLDSRMKTEKEDGQKQSSMI